MPQLKLSFPMAGVNLNYAASTQPPDTSPRMNNVRPREVLENRVRGGQRPGLEKQYGQQLGAGKPVVAICQVTTIEVETA